MLPRPRRRLDPDVVRARLLALAGIVDSPRELETTDPPATDLPPVVVRAGGSWRPFVLGVGAASLAAWVLLRGVTGGAPGPVEYVAGTPLPSAGTSSPGAAPTAAGVVVQVLGQVRHPGLVTLPTGSRVADAVRAAGGLATGGSSGSLNLARTLVDGEQIVVSPDSSAGPAGGSTSGAASIIDLNTATAAQLDAIPGVGPVLAGRIVDWRTAHGRFTSLDQLRDVSGIGARTLDRLRPYVRV